MKNKKKYRLKKEIYMVLLVIFGGILIYNLVILVKWSFDKNNNKKETEEINKIIEIKEITGGDPVNPPLDPDDDYWNYIKLPFNNVNLENLLKVNQDTVGFISVGGTNINYPVVQTKDNKYYLKHSFKKEANDAGWIFMDYRNNATNFDKNTIIYGHSRFDLTMFGTLKNILKSKWINNKDNYIIRFSTTEENTLWQVFSVYTIPTENYYITTSFNDDQDYEIWINTMIKRSEYKFNTQVNGKDQVLTLSTCHINDKNRVVMHAKLIKKMAA